MISLPPDEESEKQTELALHKKTLTRQLHRKLKKLQKKELELQEKLNQCAQWPIVQHEAELIKFHFSSIKKGSSSIIVKDWETEQPYTLILNPAHSLQQEMARRFKQAKKLQRGQIPLGQYLEHIRGELKKIEQCQQALLLSTSLEEIKSFASLAYPHRPPSQSPRSSKALSPVVYKEYESMTGMKIWVGKSAKNNDCLTFQLACGRDWWLHISGYPGSHIIIRSLKDQNPDFETLQDAFQLALYHSKARGQGEGEVCFTQRKYVSKMNKKKPGLVQISKHQTAWVRFDPVRYQALIQRNRTP